jgi:hypothetical protein
VTAAARQAGSGGARPGFAHASEAELARILDFYDVRWTYEPDTFPIAWNLEGDVIESFSPDFYLPDLELYVELTTLKQKLVRKKNRKLRRLRELYPAIRIKLFYARDFRMLLIKFGRLALLDELTGSTGQSTPPRIHHEAGVADPADELAMAEVVGLADAAEADASGDERAPDAPEAARTGRGRRRGRRRRRSGAAEVGSTAADSAGAAVRAIDPGPQPA